MNPSIKPFHIPFSRRRLLQSLMATTAGLTMPGAFAELLTMTPGMTEGPFYPDKLPLDQDNDLIRVTDHLTPAVGTITNISGRILDSKGEPLKDALVELWQADDHGTYIHTKGAMGKERDDNFQGYGKFETDSKGGYRFRTIKPGLYPGRTRHYHFAVTLPGKPKFVTQLFLSGEAGNDKDGVLNSIKDKTERDSVIREFKKVPDSVEFAASWDIIMGRTPGDSNGGHGMGPPPSRKS